MCKSRGRPLITTVSVSRCVFCGRKKGQVTCRPWDEPVSVGLGDQRAELADVFGEGPAARLFEHVADREPTPSTRIITASGSGSARMSRSMVLRLTSKPRWKHRRVEARPARASPTLSGILRSCGLRRA